LKKEDMKAIFSYDSHLHLFFYRRGILRLYFFLLIAFVFLSTTCLADLPDASGFNKLKHYKTEKKSLKRDGSFILGIRLPGQRQDLTTANGNPSILPGTFIT
jgi:hypothetical protein